MFSGSRRVFFRDYVFSVDENVYEPAEDSIFFAENLDVKKGESVLDMGTGCGILGIIAADMASRVVSIDINPFALRCAKANASLNYALSKMHFIQCDLFAALPETVRFNLILFNAPYLPSVDGEDDSWVERAWSGGTSGRVVIDRFIQQVPIHLESMGRVLLLQSNVAGIGETVNRFALKGITAKILAERKLPFFETLFLIEARID